MSKFLEIEPGVPKKISISSIGWLVTFIAIPFGGCIPGLLILLSERFINFIKHPFKWESVSAQTSIVAWANWSIVGLGLITFISGIFSPNPILALELSIANILMLYIFVSGSQKIVRSQLYFNNDFLFYMFSASIIANLVSLASFFIFHKERADILYTGCNGLGTILILVGGLVTGYLYWRGNGWKYLIIPYLALSSATLLATQSRGAWFGFTAMLATLALLNRKLLITCLIIALLVGSVFMISTPLRERLLSSFSLDNSSDLAFANDSNTVRIYIWQVTLKMIRDYPVLGVGSGVYPIIYDKYTKLETREDYRHKAFAHNIFLQVAAEFGILGLIIFGSMLSILFYTSFSLARTKNPVYQGMFASLVGLMIHQQVDIPIWGVGIGGAFWMLVGLSLGLYQYEWSAGRLKTKKSG